MCKILFHITKYWRIEKCYECYEKFIIAHFQNLFQYQNLNADKIFENNTSVFGILLVTDTKWIAKNQIETKNK